MTLTPAVRAAHAEGNNGAPVARGVMLAPLKDTHQDRIVIGDRTFFLRDGTTCNYPPGTPLEVVVYTEQDGRREADSITLDRPRN